MERKSIAVERKEEHCVGKETGRLLIPAPYLAGQEIWGHFVKLNYEC